MKQSIVQGFLVAAGLTIGYVRAAYADVAPPIGYVEQCTVDKQQASGATCVACPNDYRSFATDAGDPCQLKYAGQGYTKACKSWGASAWTEVWCQGAADAGTTIAYPMANCSGCRTSTNRHHGAMAAWLVVGAVLTMRIVVRRTRS